MAPIYDSGSSLGYDKLPGQMKADKDVVCKPFKNRHPDQLRLVQSFDWLDLTNLPHERSRALDSVSLTFHHRQGSRLSQSSESCIYFEINRCVHLLSKYVPSL